ncbi:type II toxin-antitoxin system VapC family toxin [Almyronema epifaneia]|uniref:Type II toxin-antitoxin system VapC family toxin n=1 Tax=Almyronema epifaneia S1 TaxID=2991925 RepID=A0ABW6IA65_9CYAN
MTRLFVDTSGWASFFISAEPTHKQAVQSFITAHKQKHAISTSNYVIAELVALLQSPLRVQRSQIFTIIDTIKTTPYLDVIHIGADIDAAAWQLCKSRLDKKWSLVDCASFVLMQQHDIQAALTTDHHFEQAGFTRLLNPTRT